MQPQFDHLTAKEQKVLCNKFNVYPFKYFHETNLLSHP